MIGSDGHIVLTNFACAKLLENYESTGSSCGTKEYEAPERILNWAYDFAVDIWSFGIILCIMHFGQVGSQLVIVIGMLMYCLINAENSIHLLEEMNLTHY